MNRGAKSTVRALRSLWPRVRRRLLATRLAEHRLAVCDDLRAWAQTQPLARCEVVAESETILRRPPRTADETLLAEFVDLYEFQSPQRLLISIPGGRIRGRSGVVLLPNGEYAGELLALTPAGRRRVLHNELVLGEPASRRRIHKRGTYYAALGIGASNFHHYINDVVVKLAALQSRLPADTRFIVPDPLLSFQQAALAPLQLPTDRIVGLPPGEEWEVERLIVASPIAKTITATGEYYRPYRALAFEHYGITDHAPVRRLFVSRRNDNYRRPSNEAHVAAVLTEYGFETIEPATLTFADQIKVFAQAEAIVGTGAGLSNMMFAPPGAKVLEFYERTITNTTFWSMATALRLEYFAFRCNEVANPRDAIPDLDVPVATLAAALEEMLSNR